MDKEKLQKLRDEAEVAWEHYMDIKNTLTETIENQLNSIIVGIEDDKVYKSNERYRSMVDKQISSIKDAIECLGRYKRFEDIPPYYADYADAVNRLEALERMI